MPVRVLPRFDSNVELTKYASTLDRTINATTQAQVLHDPLANVVTTPNGSPMLAPMDCDPVEQVAAVGASDSPRMRGFGANRPFDLQRTNNGEVATGGLGFVSSWPPVLLRRLALKQLNELAP